MGFLSDVVDSVKQRFGAGEAEPSRQEPVSSGRATREIEIVSRTPHVAVDGREVTALVGQSKEGFHAAAEVQGADWVLEPRSWSDATPSLLTAEKLALEMKDMHLEELRLEHLHESGGPHITTHSISDWHVAPGGEFESRTLIGKSPDGFHPALEVSYGGGDDGADEPHWGDAVPTYKEARALAEEMQTGYLRPDVDMDSEARAQSVETGKTERAAVEERRDLTGMPPWAVEAREMIAADLREGAQPDQVVSSLMEWLPEKGDAEFYTNLVRSAMSEEQQARWTPSVDVPSPSIPSQSMSALEQSGVDAPSLSPSR